MLVRHWMTRDVVTVTPDTSVLNARRLMDTYAIRHLPVVEDGAVVGVCSDRNVRTADPALAHALDNLRSELAEGRYRPVASLMSAPARTIAPTDTIAQASTVMITERIGVLPVVEEGRLVGILSLLDCLRAYLAAEREQARRALAHPCLEDDPDRWVHIPRPPRGPRTGWPEGARALLSPDEDPTPTTAPMRAVPPRRKAG